MEELKEEINRLLAFFEIDEDQQEWPSIAVWSTGDFHVGPIPDELYDILINIKQILEEEE